MLGKREVNLKQVEVRLKDPNPIFKRWLKNWHEEAKVTNSKLAGSFNLALQSLDKYPLELRSGQDCIILVGFNSTICRMIDDELEKLGDQQPKSTGDEDLKKNFKVIRKKKE